MQRTQQATYFLAIVSVDHDHFGEVFNHIVESFQSKLVQSVRCVWRSFFLSRLRVRLLFLFSFFGITVFDIVLLLLYGGIPLGTTSGTSDHGGNAFV
jgi:hypothetical protein